jgi:hypothetical protein
MTTEEERDERKRADLERRGLLRRGRGEVRAEILNTPPPRLPNGMSVLDALLEERKRGR